MKSFILLLSLLFTLNLIGQCPDSGGTIYLTNQTLVDDFGNDYPNCEELDNTLIIGHTGAPMTTNIDDLTGLSSLKRINGTLRVRNVDLIETFEGLHNLEFIEDDLIIGDNELLKNLNDFNGIDSIGGDLDIYNNLNLETLFEKDSIIYIGNSLRIFDNPILTEILGFKELKSIRGSLQILNNELLKSNEGFENLENINGGLDIALSPNLENLTGFDLLTTIGNGMKIRVTGIKDFTGFEKLEIIQGSLVGNSVSITDNPNLISLSGLGALDSIQRSLFITGNQELESIEALSNLKFIGGQLSIENSNLTEISALKNVAPINSTIRINENENLISIDELPLASKIDGSIEIKENTKLNNINPLSNLDTLLGQLNVSENTSLSECSSLCPLLNHGFIESIITIRENLGNCEDEDILISACSTKTKDESDLPSYLIYPNPVENILYINTDYFIQKLTILRLDGSIENISEFNYEPSSIAVDVTDLASGLYYIDLVIDGRRETKKFIKL